jgi:hypothetical protein
MTLIQNLISNLPAHYALLGLILAIGLTVVALRAIIRLAMRAFLFGLLGVILLGVVYYIAR